MPTSGKIELKAFNSEELRISSIRIDEEFLDISLSTQEGRKILGGYWGETREYYNINYEDENLKITGGHQKPIVIEIKNYSGSKKYDIGLYGDTGCHVGHIKIDIGH